MKTLKKRVGQFLKYGTLISSIGFVGATLIQIYARFFMESAPSWTEEAARFFFIYAMSFAAGLAMKSDYYVYFEFMFNKLNSKKQRILKLLVSFSTVVLFVIMVIFSLQFVRAGLDENSPSLGFPMAIAFFSIVLMGASVIFYAAIDFFKTLKKK
jgi:TRAP-type C4-dicarboxylate transport system permease small subunit